MKYNWFRSLNSTMVRLKRKDQKMKRFDWFASQFHYGSIKTQFPGNGKRRDKTSQFHYGSIKTKIEVIARI